MKSVVGIAICSFFGIGLCHGQQTITKKIIDSTDRLPLQFVNISVVGRPGHGTITNEDGVFTLHLPDKTDSLRISHVGYHNLRIPASFGNDTVLMIPATTFLNEVTISALSASQVIQETIAKLERNHSVEPVGYDAFIRIVEYPADTNQIHLFEEHAVKIYQTKDSNSKFKLQKTRVAAFSKPGEKRLTNLRLINMVSVYADNLFRYPDDFLTQRKSKKFTYRFLDDLKADTAYYAIACHPESDTAVIAAKLLIDKKSFAIVQLQKFYENESNWNNYKIITFEEHETKWYLSHSHWHFQSSIYERYGDPGITITDRICLYNISKGPGELKHYKSTLNIFAEPIKRYTEDFKDDYWDNLDFVPIPTWIEKRLR